MKVLFFAALTVAFSAHSENLTLKDAILKSLENRPEIKINLEKETQAIAQESMAHSFYYPSIDLSAVQSIGLPGSSAPVPSSFGGLMTSPYRSGSSVGLLAKYSLLDFEKYNAQAVAKESINVQKGKSRLNETVLITRVVEAYLDSVRSQHNRDVWKEIKNKIERVETASKALVKSGQNSDVSYFLIRDQKSEAQLNYLVEDEHYKSSLQRLALLTGLKNVTLNANEILESPEETTLGSVKPQRSPLLNGAESELNESKAKLNQVDSQAWPKFFAAASYGYLEDTRIVEKQNYSAFLGITIPVFEGFRHQAETTKSKSEYHEKELQLESSKMNLQEAQNKFDEVIRISRIEILELGEQKKSALKTFDHANRRFERFLGPMVEVRESIRVLSRIDLNLAAKKIELVSALVAKQLNSDFN